MNDDVRRDAPNGLDRRSSVLAIVPHFRCEPWLGDCLDALLRQTRPLDGIVVIDDGSGTPPTEIVRRFPSVTLVACDENVGPYRLSQTAIDNTAYDGYLFQDADDWSLPTRLELLLREAERSGAGLIGCQGYRLISAEGEVVPLTFPLDVNAALARRPTIHAVMHPSSIVSRDLVARVGGYASGLRFGADTEFEHRAVHVARLRNIPQFAYVVRNRPHSLTSSPETGLQSALRTELKTAEFDRARANAERVVQGLSPVLAPLATAAPVRLTHLAGPPLRSAHGEWWPA